MSKQASSFVTMLRDAVSGAVSGLFAGLLLGVVIYILTFLVNPVALEEGPGAIAPFLGMGFGTLVGAVLGGLAGLKGE